MLDFLVVGTTRHAPDGWWTRPPRQPKKKSDAASPDPTVKPADAAPGPVADGPVPMDGIMTVAATAEGYEQHSVPYWHPNLAQMGVRIHRVLCIEVEPPTSYIQLQKVLRAIANLPALLLPKCTMA